MAIEAHAHWLTPRRRTLAVLLLLVAPAFAGTAIVTRLFRQEQRTVAAERYARGTKDLERGDAAAAVEELRAALSLLHVAPPIRLRLAQALVAAKRPAEARSQLLTLREGQPGNAVINLELARLAVGRGDTALAARYYHDAVEGAWDADAERRRRETRVELAEVLVRAGEVASAQAELTLAAADLPPDPSFRVRVASLLSSAGAHERAFQVYRSALALKADDPRALAGAGNEAIETARYATARTYLARAIARDPANTPARNQLALLSLVASLDPFPRGVPARERGRRAFDAWAYAVARLAACRAQSPARLQGLEPLQASVDALDKDVNARRLARDPEKLDSAMDLAFEIEERTREACGEPQGADLALLLIGRDRRAVER